MEGNPTVNHVNPPSIGMSYAMAGIAMICLLCVEQAPAYEAAAKKDLTTLGIEELMNIEVTSVSKKTQRLSEAAAAVFVITQKDIRRSGATNLADVLRMVPGVQVARIDANKWAISIRGFGSRFANKLLVLMDGRSLYSPLFSGVFWNIQDTVMEDIDRIEVIRGPGAALWGANAVNGVINIITKAAAETNGGLLSVGGGTEERGFATARYGTNLGEGKDIRFYGKYLNHAGGVDASGNDVQDAWHDTRGGFRYDADTTDRDNLTLQGDYYEGIFGETDMLYRLPTPLNPAVVQKTDVDNGTRGGNILSRWRRRLSDTANLSLQFYYDHTQQDMVGASGKTDTFDLDFQHRFALGDAQDIIWGLGYRFGSDEIENAFTASLFPPKKDYRLISAFLHDEITLLPNRLSMILGSRFEHNDYSGFEIQPNGRLVFTPTPQHTIWVAVSRALRTPSRGDQDILYRQSVIPPPLPTPIPFPLNQLPAAVTIYGSQDFKSEELMAYELGYRTDQFSHVSLDIATFYNRYNYLRTARMGTAGVDSLTAPTHVVFPFITGNDMHGQAYGAELTARWNPLPWWKVQVAYSYLKLNMELDNGSTDNANKGNAEGSSPQNQLSLRSGFDIGKQTTLDLWLRSADRLSNIGGNTIPGYATLDVRLAWRPVSNLELSIAGQNLLQKRHQEFIPEFIESIATEAERSVYGKVTWDF